MSTQPFRTIGIGVIFFPNLKANVLMYKEQSSGGNYYKLKDKLDNIPEKQDVVFDFSFCEFVDHTAMNNLNVYRELCTINE